ncbi:dipeptidase [Cytobacillus dafuensis]|uniref:Membrane dipeptidase n=1 Tax=Cytobacillus dafuensis TaxID=1742359 RepID=A0A5B8Z066_CYTDA|nr:membrane dipeptidase [Cytobacillus dafuensis]QED46404.1 hypothetical protein FSZ17_03495 [Cytobacillus dafuensis]
MKIFDLHSDIFTDIAIRRERGENRVFDQVHFPRLKRGGIHAILCVIWVEPNYRGNEYERFHAILSHVMDDLAESEHAEIVSFAATENNRHSNTNKIQIYLGLEGLTFMERWEGPNSYARIQNSTAELDKIMFKHAIFSWNERNFLAVGTGCPKIYDSDGLTSVGKFTVGELEQSSWIIDVSHLNEKSFWDVYSVSQQPIMASHSNSKVLCNVDRNLTDEQMKAIVSTGGIIGLNAYGEFVDRNKPTVSRFVDHVIYMADLVGVDSISFGFDFMDYLMDYNLGGPPVILTEGLENVTMIPNLIDNMIKRGFSSKEIEIICFDNAFNFLQKIYQKT